MAPSERADEDDALQPAEGRRARRKRELRARIFETARSLILAQGFEATTVEQIAEAADVAPTTFFNHFKSKQAILEEMAGEVLEGYWASLEGQRKRDASTEERLAAFASQVGRFIQRTPDATRTVLLDLMHRGSGKAGPRPKLAPTYRLFQALFEDGQARGDTRADFAAAVLAELTASLFHGVVARWLEDPDYPLDARLAEAARFLAVAIAPAPASDTAA